MILIPCLIPSRIMRIPSISNTFCRQNYAFSSKPPRESQKICKLSANNHEINRKLLTVNYKLLSPGGPIPHNHGEDRFGPPTLERSGSEHRRAVTSLALLERARAWEWVKDPPAGVSGPYKGNRKGRKDY